MNDKDTKLLVIPGQATKRLAKLNLAGVIKLLESDGWGDILAFDTFRVELVTVAPTPWNPSDHVWTDHDTSELLMSYEDNDIDLKVTILERAIETVARRHRFHPVEEYLNSIKWDTKERIKNWLSTYFGVRDNEYTRGVGQRWLISAVARILKPGSNVDTMLILEGLQGTYKSQAIKILAGEKWFTDHLPDVKTKDAAMQLHGTWILEVGELKGIATSQQTVVKAYLSRSTDKFRPPYGRRVEEFPRQTVFVGTTNAETYLRDETGNRRYWPVRCRGKIDLARLAKDRDHLWAEAVVRFRRGAKWWLDSEALEQLARGEQEARIFVDPWEERIGNYLGESRDTSQEEILNALGKPVSGQNTKDTERIAPILQKLGWERYRASQPKPRPWRYRKIEKS